MREGLLPGSNWIGELQWRRSLRQGMFLQLFYQVRSLPGYHAVHAAQISLQAVF